jgi:cytoskeletal protein CcmA (bactofilin family)
MRNNKSPVIEKNTGTVIGQGILIENATLTGCGVIRIDGEFSGNIDIQGRVILGETGNLRGNVKAESALFAGIYKGDICITNTLHLVSTANLDGHIETGKIVIEEGAIISATCNTISPDSRNRSVYEIKKEEHLLNNVAVR